MPRETKAQREAREAQERATRRPVVLALADARDDLVDALDRAEDFGIVNRSAVRVLLAALDAVVPEGFGRQERAEVAMEELQAEFGDEGSDTPFEPVPEWHECLDGLRLTDPVTGRVFVPADPTRVLADGEVVTALRHYEGGDVALETARPDGTGDEVPLVLMEG